MSVHAQHCFRLARCLAMVAALAPGAKAADGDPAAIATICPNFVAASSSVPFPRSALQRRLMRGEALIAFTVTPDHRTVDITPVSSSDPAFAEAALAVVKKLECKGGTEPLQLRVPFTYNLEPSSNSYPITADEIQPDRLRETIPRIAELRTETPRITLKPGEGIRLGALKVFAYDASGQKLGRLTASDRDAQPRTVFAFRGPDIVQALAPGDGYIEIAAPLWKELGGGRPKPSVRIEVFVQE